MKEFISTFLSLFYLSAFAVFVKEKNGLDIKVGYDDEEVMWKKLKLRIIKKRNYKLIQNNTNEYQEITKKY